MFQHLGKIEINTLVKITKIINTKYFCSRTVSGEGENRFPYLSSAIIEYEKLNIP